MARSSEDRSALINGIELPRYWVVKGKPGRNDFSEILKRGRREYWRTRRPPRDWVKDDRVFLWEGSPACRLVGLGTITGFRDGSADETQFEIAYCADVLDNPTPMSELRDDSVVGTASFLKAGAAGTVFRLNHEQAAKLFEHVHRSNSCVRELGWFESGSEDSKSPPSIALSLRQPWAELVLRGVKTIEVRSRATHKRGNVYIYSSLGRLEPEREVALGRDFGLDVDTLPRGLILGTVEIVGCRRLSPKDSPKACFSIPENYDHFGWELAQPKRFTEPLRPTRHPQPVFFRPF